MIEYTVVGPDGAEHRRGGADDLRSAAAATTDVAFVWVAIESPDTPALGLALDALGLERFGVDPEHAVHHRPKVEAADGALMLLAKTVWYIEATRQVETGELAIYTDGHSLVTAGRGVADPVPAVRERLRDPAFRAGGPAAVVQALFGAVVGEYDAAVEDLAEDVADLERAVFSGERVDRYEDIYFLIRETLEFQNAVRPLTPLARMIKEHHGDVAALAGPRMKEAAGHLIRVDGAIETCMSLLTTVLTAHQGQIGTWQNEDMKKISAWAAIALAPTLIAGIYGMNFDDMPELHWPFGYPAALTLMVLVSLSLYRGFKRNGWLLSVTAIASQWERARGGAAVPALDSRMWMRRPRPSGPACLRRPL
jgi:magnesium transporter